jgi:uncharacterized protein YbaR (Trm112 family)
MPLDVRLLEVLACPRDKGPLLYFGAEALLYNPRLRVKYRVERDIPQMLIDEALSADPAEHARLMALARSLNLSLNF